MAKKKIVGNKRNILILVGIGIILSFILINNQNTSGEPKNALDLVKFGEGNGLTCEIIYFEGREYNVVCGGNRLGGEQIEARVFPGKHKYTSGIASFVERKLCSEFISEMEHANPLILDQFDIYFTEINGWKIVTDGSLNRKALCNNADTMYISMTPETFDKYMDVI